MNSNVSKLSWKVIFKPHYTDDIEILFDGDQKKTLQYYEKLSKKKMKPGSAIALMNPKGTSIRSRHAKASKINEIKLKQITKKNIIFSILFLLFAFLTILNLNQDIFISNFSFISSIVTFFILIFYIIKFFKNKRKTLYINL